MEHRVTRVETKTNHNDAIVRLQGSRIDDVEDRVNEHEQYIYQIRESMLRGPHGAGLPAVKKPVVKSKKKLPAK